MVAVIIPSYNRASLISEAVASVLATEWPATRVVIVDDGSTDDTERVCRSLQQRHPEVIAYHRKRNGGCASARNFGLDRIPEDSEFVCFLDSDDRLLPATLAARVAFMLAHPGADFCYSDSMVFDQETGLEVRRRAAAAGEPARFAIEHLLSNEAKSAAILYRRRAVRGRRFREELRYSEDSEFLQRIAIECVGEYFPRATCWVRGHRGSKSRDLLAVERAVLRSTLDIIESYPEFVRCHAALIEWRVKNIRYHLFGLLAAEGRWPEAREYADGWLHRGVLLLKLRSYFRIRRYLAKRSGRRIPR